MLRDSERLAYHAAATFASTLRSLQASSAPWSCVGLYYTSFFAARSILGMHGGWVDGDKQWLEATNINPGSIEITLRTARHPAIQAKQGSHKAFWSVFYFACRPLHPHAAAQHSFALSPVQSSSTWLIDNRNRINYGSADASKLVDEFQRRYDPTNVAQSLPGDVKVFRNVAISLLALANQFRRAHGLATDAPPVGALNLDEAINNQIRANRDVALDAFSSAELMNFVA
ncbi:hypothetical protein [Aquimonas voraii]|nr:hypothetical protein [Aquimonas voraii]